MSPAERTAKTRAEQQERIAAASERIEKANAKYEAYKVQKKNK